MKNETELISVVNKVANQYNTSETKPYFLSFEQNHTSTEDFHAVIEGHAAYQNENFGKLLQIISTIGSCCVASKININKKHYFLGEKLRIRKCDYTERDGNLITTTQAIIQSSKKAKALINIQDQSGSIVYRFELDYNIFPEQVFEKLFKQNYCTEPLGTPIDGMPQVVNEAINANSFLIFINEFSKEHCLGHFENYPIVPAVFIVKCVLKGIYEWLGHKSKDVKPEASIDSLEIFATKAMPTGVKFHSSVNVVILSSKENMFICNIIDDAKNSYGHYLITIKYQ